MNLPIPSHLREILIPTGDKNTEYEVTGVIRCTWDHEIFHVEERSNRQIINLRCAHCGKEHLLFHAGKHGWDGFVCGGDIVFLVETLPSRAVECEKCTSKHFRVQVWISSQGPQDFLEECVAHDDSFTADDWVDGFEWITVDLTCASCGKVHRDWLDYETM